MTLHSWSPCSSRLLPFKILHAYKFMWLISQYCYQRKLWRERRKKVMKFAEAKSLYTLVLSTLFVAHNVIVLSEFLFFFFFRLEKLFYTHSSRWGLSRHFVWVPPKLQIPRTYQYITRDMQNMLPCGSHHGHLSNKVLIPPAGIGQAAARLPKVSDMHS